MSEPDTKRQSDLLFELRERLAVMIEAFEAAVMQHDGCDSLPDSAKRAVCRAQEYLGDAFQAVSEAAENAAENSGE